MKVEDLKVKLYADGADINVMKEMYKKGWVSGFTTNPTLMKRAGVTDYVKFAKQVVKEIPDRSLSFEVFSDEFETMAKEARKISSWGENVYVKIPITNTKGESSIPLIKLLSEEGLQLNVTAILALEQAKEAIDVLSPETKNYISVFAGRIADTGRDAKIIMKQVAMWCNEKPGTEALWASCREVYNIIEADETGTHIITVTNDVLNKLHLLEKDLIELSLETVNMLTKDGQSLGFSVLGED